MRGLYPAVATAGTDNAAGLLLEVSGEMLDLLNRLQTSMALADDSSTFVDSIRTSAKASRQVRELVTEEGPVGKDGGLVSDDDDAVLLI